MPTSDPSKKREKERRKYETRKANNPEYLKRKSAKKDEKRKSNVEYNRKRNQRKEEKRKALLLNYETSDKEKERLKTKTFTYQSKLLSERKNFLAYDGEGGEGKYTLLANTKDYIYNPEGLTTLECLAFLTQRENVKARVFFFFSYDINLICKDIPKEDLIELFHNETVQYGVYQLTYIPRKIFKIKLKNTTYTYYDTGTFFMTSLINAAKKAKIEIPDIIKKGKSARGKSLLEWSKEDLIEYNRQECIILETLMEKLKESLSIEVFGKSLVPRGWYGPGAVANILMSGLRARNQTIKEERIPDEIKEILPYGFYGGRIESLKLGMFNCPIYSYDIRSAYPYQISTLPELSTNWDIINNPSWLDMTLNPYSLWLVEWHIPEKEKHLPGPFPLRDKNGYIYFPGNGKGWYYGGELRTVLEVYPIEWFRVRYGYVMEDSGIKPFKEKIEFLYDYRAKLKRENDPRELALKLSYNSAYGKFIQNVGSRRYRSLFYAGLITSQTRSQLLKACKNNLYDVISFQTDGIKSLKPLDLELSESLGSWEFEKYERIQILGSGIYRCLGSEGNYKNTTSRGYNLERLEADGSIARQGFNFDRVCEEVKKKGFSDIPTNLFIGNLLGIIQEESRGKHINDFVEITRRYSPMKLADNYDDHKKRVYNFFGFPDLSREKYNSSLYYFSKAVMTYPYGTFQIDEIEKEEDREILESDLSLE